MSNILVIDLGLCTGCRNCELACSQKHTSTFNPRRSRIQVLKDESRNVILPLVCLHCEVPLCAGACPTSAIIKDDAGTLVVDTKKCVGCSDCVTACVYGGVVLDPMTQRAIKCDLCSGDPACVKACQYGAITMLPRELRGLRGRYEGTKRVLQSYLLIEEGT